MTAPASALALALAGRTALITGGNGGIGLGMASALGAAGADIVIWGRDEAKNAAALERLAAEDTEAHAFVCDVADPESIAETFAASVDTAGAIDCVFANAGRGGSGAPFLEVSLDEWRAVFAVNLDAVFVLFQAAARHMVDRGEGGSLVAVSSTSAIHGAANNEAYGSSKTALLGLTRALAVGLARHDIRVNALLPGWTRTGMSESAYAWDKFRERTTARTPARRWADPDEMGPAAVFLADPTTTFHTGQTVVVDGGYTVF
ncbi:MAG: SDR family oxidoreductase [Acidimicrobiales bacterium]|nr:SDR family oxidoreductase [Acidimicrobiales bacterium]